MEMHRSNASVMLLRTHRMGPEPVSFLLDMLLGSVILVSVQLGRGSGSHGMMRSHREKSERAHVRMNISIGLFHLGQASPAVELRAAAALVMTRILTATRSKETCVERVSGGAPGREGAGLDVPT